MSGKIDTLIGHGLAQAWRGPAHIAVHSCTEMITFTPIRSDDLDDLASREAWVDVFRDKSTKCRQQLESIVDPDDVLLTPFTKLELLQGCRDEHEWSLLSAYLETQMFREPQGGTWASAARIFFDLRRLGKTARSPVDCCIVQIAIDHQSLLLHRDRDFVVIAEIRPLQQRFLQWDS